MGIMLYYLLWVMRVYIIKGRAGVSGSRSGLEALGGQENSKPLFQSGRSHIGH